MTQGMTLNDVEDIEPVEQPKPDMFAIVINGDLKVEEQRADQMLAQYEKFEIKTNADYEQTGAIKKEIQRRIKALEADQKIQTQPLEKAKKDWIAWFKRPLDKYETVKRIVDNAITVYYNKAEEERKKAEKIARDLAEAEAKKLEAKADKQEAKGNETKADDLRAQAQQVGSIVPVILSSAPKLAGVAMIDVWNFEITDELAIDRKFLMIDESKIRKTVNALKGDFQEKGIRVWSSKAPRGTR